MPRPSGASHKEEMGLLKAQVVTLEAKLAACNIKVTDLDHVVAALQGEMGDYKLQTSATVKALEAAMYAQGQQLARILRDTRKEERGANKARNIQDIGEKGISASRHGDALGQGVTILPTTHSSLVPDSPGYISITSTPRQVESFTVPQTPQQSTMIAQPRPASSSSPIMDSSQCTALPSATSASILKPAAAPTASPVVRSAWGAPLTPLPTPPASPTAVTADQAAVQKSNPQHGPVAPHTRQGSSSKGRAARSRRSHSGSQRGPAPARSAADIAKGPAPLELFKGKTVGALTNILVLKGRGTNKPMSREHAAEEAAALYLRIDANPDAADGLVDYTFRLAHVSRTPAAQAFMPAFWREWEACDEADKLYQQCLAATQKTDKAAAQKNVVTSAAQAVKKSGNNRRRKNS